MIDFLDRLEDQLLSSPPPRRRPSRRAAGLAGIVTLAISGTALAATQPWMPAIGDDRRGTPQHSTASIPQEQLNGMGVLRRPQTDRDRGPVVQQALRLTDENVAGVRTNAARALVSPALTAALIPVEQFNLRTSKMIDPRMSEDLKQLLAVQKNGLCVFAPDPAGDGGGYQCSSWQRIKAGQMPSSIGHILYGVVPDGIATVRIRFENGATVSTKVADNFYAVAAPTKGPRQPHEISSADWIGPDGQHLRELSAPRPPHRSRGAG